MATKSLPIDNYLEISQLPLQERISADQEKARVIGTYDAKEAVKGLLKDSSSADFSGEMIGKGGAVCGYVNAKNSFGAYAGNSRYISTNGQSAIDDGSQSFNDSWKNLCN